MHKSAGIILREFIGIRGGPSEENSYESNLRECLTAKRRANEEADLVGAGHAARGTAECYRRLGQLNEAAEEYESATNYFRLASDQKGLAWTLLAYSNLLRQSSRYAAAFNGLSEALTLAKTCRDLGLMAYIVAGIGETTRVVGNYRRAHRQHASAYEMFRSLDDSRGMIWALEGIGQMFKNAGRLCEAQERFDEAKKLAMNANDSRGLGYALKCRAECLSGFGHHRSAVEEASLAVQIFENIGLKVGLGYALKSLGDIFRANHDYIGALLNYRKAAQVFSKINDARGLAYTFNGLGALLSETDGAKNAGVCFVHAANYFRATGLSFGQTQGMSGLLRLTQRQGLNAKQLREVFQSGLEGQLPLPSVLLETSGVLPPERCELVQAGWRLLSQYRRSGVRYLRAEKAKVWNGANQADCSSFVQHTLIEAGYGFARLGRLTTARLNHDSFWSQCFQELSQNECKPGDIILQGGKHMGIFTGVRSGQLTGFQMGVASKASELVWGENSDTAPVGQGVRFFRLKTRST